MCRMCKPVRRRRWRQGRWRATAHHRLWRTGEPGLPQPGWDPGSNGPHKSSEETAFSSLTSFGHHNVRSFSVRRWSRSPRGRRRNAWNSHSPTRSCPSATRRSARWAAVGWRRMQSTHSGSCTARVPLGPHGPRRPLPFSVMTATARGTGRAGPGGALRVRRGRCSSPSRCAAHPSRGTRPAERPLGDLGGVSMRSCG